VEPELHGAPSPQAHRAWEQVLRPLALNLASNAHALSVAMLDQIRPQLPDLFPDPEAVESNRASSEANIRAFAELLADGGDPHTTELPPETIAYARDGARQRTPLTALMRSYRLGHAMMTDVLQREIIARADTAEALTEALALFTTYSFAYIDTALILTDQTYAAERERWARSAAAVRAETIEAILAGHQSDARTAGRRLGYELDREHIGVLAWLDVAPTEADPLGILETAIDTLKTAVGGSSSLVQPTGLLAATAWLSSSAALENPPLNQLPHGPTATPGVRVALGQPARGLAGFRTSHAEATHARRVATLTQAPPGSITSYEHVALQAMATIDPDQAHAFVHRQLGALAASDDTSLRLIDTLQVYLDEHASRSRAAKRLGVHENTISYRIRQVEEILGRSVEDHTLELRVALALADSVTGRGSQPG
jgi:PucR-like helix-turn-helix protein/diguanylate cyclase with GGDEF domain